MLRVTRPRGRPPKLAEDRSDSILGVRVTQEQRQLIESAAHARRLQLSDWIRTVILEAAARPLERRERNSPTPFLDFASQIKR